MDMVKTFGDSGQENEGILILGKQSWFVFLRQSEVWNADGAFKMSPLLFYLVQVFMTRRHGGVFPVLYALLPNKRRVTYIRMFRMINDLLQDVQPQNIYCDCEHAVFSVMEEYFPGVQLKGGAKTVVRQNSCAPNSRQKGVAKKYPALPQLVVVLVGNVPETGIMTQAQNLNVHHFRIKNL